MGTKRGAVRGQEPPSSQEQEMGLVQMHHLLHGTLPARGYTDEISPMVPLQHASKGLSTARRAGIDPERQPFLPWRGCTSGAQQRAPLAILIERQGRAQRQKQLREAERLLEASATIVTQIDSEGTEGWKEMAERLPQIL